jgi:hypothetical protein
VCEIDDEFKQKGVQQLTCVLPSPTPRFITFIEQLESASRDNLDFLKDRSMKTAFELLLEKPEQVCGCGCAGGDVGVKG